MANLTALLTALSDLVWGPVMIVALVGTGLYLTIRLRFVQVRRFSHAIRCISGAYDKPEDEGDVTHFQALAAALSATIGTGNIVGVATAIAMGGPGAVFWMWVTALVGMATKFTSCSLALRFREIHADGTTSGGPMYTLERGFRPRWIERLAGADRTRRWATFLAVAFALFAMIASFGIGNMVQANSVVDGLREIVPPAVAEATWHIDGFNWTINLFRVGTGGVIAVLVGLVILGGIRRIAQVASRIVPFMCVLYAVGALATIAIHIEHLPIAIGQIFRYAFTPFAAGAGFTGFVIAQTMRFGVARGVFSNESGLGSAPMAHAAAKTTEMVREGFVAMLGPFIDTIVVCSMTALAILCTDAWQVRDEAGHVLYGIDAPNGYASADGRFIVVDPDGEPVRDARGEAVRLPAGADLTIAAFENGLSKTGEVIVAIGLMFFAYSTMISWSYYGDRCAEFLFGPRLVLPYRMIYCVLIVVGAAGGLTTVWTLADVLNALMAVPNLVSLVALGGLVSYETRHYLRRLDAGEFETS